MSTIVLIFDIAYNYWGLYEHIVIWRVCSSRPYFGISFIHWRGSAKRFLYLCQLFDICDIIVIRLSGRSFYFNLRRLKFICILLHSLLKLSHIMTVLIGNFGLLVSILLNSNNLRGVIAIVFVERFFENKVIGLYCDARRLSLLIDHFLLDSFWFSNVVEFICRRVRTHVCLGDNQVIHNTDIRLLLLHIRVCDLTHSYKVVQINRLLCLLKVGFTRSLQSRWESNGVPSKREISLILWLFDRLYHILLFWGT